MGLLLSFCFTGNGDAEMLNNFAQDQTDSGRGWLLKWLCLDVKKKINTQMIFIFYMIMYDKKSKWKEKQDTKIYYFK